MSKENLSLAKAGEDAAVALLKKNGCKILSRNYKTRLGEIDIIAQDQGTLCFIEVKTRHSDKFGLPQEAVSLSKQRHIAQAALLFLKEKNLMDKPARFDVVSVIYAQGLPKIDLFKNAFELDMYFT